VPFSGTVSSSGISVAGGNGSTGAVKSNALDSNVTGLDAGDTVRFVMVIENIGTSYRGAFNVQLRDELPAGLTFTPGSLRIVDGSGALMGYTKPDGTAASPADIFSASGVRLSDPGPTAAAPLTGAEALSGLTSGSSRKDQPLAVLQPAATSGQFLEGIGGLPAHPSAHVQLFLALQRCLGVLHIGQHGPQPPANGMGGLAAEGFKGIDGREIGLGGQLTREQEQQLTQLQGEAATEEGGFMACQAIKG
jgi:uncharacterized repeat protein (TIGR01451 family)